MLFLAALGLFFTSAGALLSPLAAGEPSGSAGNPPATGNAPFSTTAVVQAAAGTEQPHKKITAPVILNGKTLFEVKQRIFSFSPAERAEIISEKLRKLLKDPLSAPGSIAVSESESVSEITAGDTIIMAVTDTDAKAAGGKRRELADNYAGIIRETLNRLRKTHSIKAILLGILFTSLATIALFFIFSRMAGLVRIVLARIAAWEGTRIRPIKIQSLELVPAEHIADFLKKSLKLAHFVIILAALYFYIPLVFSFFPWTRGLAGSLFDYVMLPLKATLAALVSYTPDLLFIAVIVVIFRYSLKPVHLFFSALERKKITLSGFYPEWAEPTYKITRFLIIVFAAIIIFPRLPGSESPVFRGISVFIGVLFSLGSTSAVANMVAGIVLTYMRPFKIGDRIKVSDTTGDVIEKTLLVTRIRTIKNTDVTVPNAMVLGSHIINYSSCCDEKGLILSITVSLGYSVPWRRAHELLTSAALSTPDILQNPAPFVLQTALNDFHVSYELNAYTNLPEKMVQLYSLMHQNIQDKFSEAGIEIMSPRHTALRDGNNPELPAGSTPAKSAPPGFRLLKIEETDRRNIPTKHL
ncbi:MAG: mechanosensitive ion channel family protein [bacterium]